MKCPKIEECHFRFLFYFKIDHVLIFCNAPPFYVRIFEMPQILKRGKWAFQKMIDPVVLKMKNSKFREVQPTNCWPSDDKWELNFNETYLQVFRACRDQSFYYLIFFVWSKVLSNQYFCKEITRLRTVHHFQMIFMVFFRSGYWSLYNLRLKTF